MEIIQYKHKKKVLIHLHVYYLDQLESFLRSIRKLSDEADFDLFVTMNKNLYEKKDIKKKILNRIPNSCIVKVEDKGYDIGPFITVIKKCDLNKYDYVLKLHTKNNNNKKITVLNNRLVSSRIWEKIMIDSLIGSRKRIGDVFKIFENNKKVGLAAASMCLTRDDDQRYNYYFERVNDELKKMRLKEIENNDFRFAAGTMFIIRSKLLSPLLVYSCDDFGDNYSCINDYTFAHTFERLFSGVVIAQGYDLYGLYSKNYNYEIAKIEKKILKKETNSSLNAIVEELVNKIHKKYMFTFRKKKAINDSDYFDAEWYKKEYLTKNKINVNPIEHYLLYGYKNGCHPSVLFDGQKYMNNYSDLKNKDINPLLHYECYGKYENRSLNKSDFVQEAEIDLIRRSSLFDGKWYLTNNPDVKQEKEDPALHYYIFGATEGRDPSPDFCGKEYLEINQDVKRDKINPLFHFEKYGKKENRAISYNELISNNERIKSIPSFEKEFRINPYTKGRTAIIAVNVENGTISNSLCALLNGVRKVTDNIIIIGNNGIYEEEINKIKDIVSYACFKRHRMNYFGSYKIGYQYARKKGLFDVDENRELVILNDSYYGPIFPFESSFYEMKEKKWDYWYYLGTKMENKIEADSSFLVLGKRVINSKLLDEFFYRIKERSDLINLDPAYEKELSFVLGFQNLAKESFVPQKIAENMIDDLVIIESYKVPIIRKASTYDNLDKKIKIIKRINPELSQDILYENSNIQPIEREKFNITKYRNSLENTKARIRKRIKEGKTIRVAFLVFNSSIFPARPLFDLMIKDKMFEPKIYVIPDTRFGDKNNNLAAECENDLRKLYEKRLVFVTKPDNYNIWPDIMGNLDIVFYPTQYNASNYKYNVRYSIEKTILPIYISYGFNTNKYGYELTRLYNYVYFWRIFYEEKDIYDQYIKNSIIKGVNADVVGYIKMDSLNKITKRKHERKTILIALHHSIEDGFNNILSLAVFLRYSDYFLKLPDRFPDIDFIYRPHPYLTKALENISGWGAEMTKEYIEKINNKPNSSWVEEGDYFKYFVESDACIQDCASFLAEYFYTKNPCCYMLKEKKDINEKFSKLGKKCLKRCYISYNKDDIDNFIKDVVIRGNDYKKADRENFAKEIMINYPEAGKKALEIIVNNIQKK